MKNDMPMNPAPAAPHSEIDEHEGPVIAFEGDMAASFQGRKVGDSVSIEGKATIQDIRPDGSVQVEFTAVTAGDDQDELDQHFNSEATKAAPGYKGE